MVNSFCRAEDFQQIENKMENVNIVRFSKEPILTPVIDGEGELRYTFRLDSSECLTK